MQHFLLTRKKIFIAACFLFCLGSTVSMAQTVTVTITQSGGQSDPSNSSSIFFAATFSEAVNGFGLEPADVTVGGTAGATTAVVTGSGFSYTIEVTGMTMDGTVTVTIPAAAATGSAPPVGRNNQASINTDNSVTYDGTAPIITASSIINLAPTEFTLRVNADENSTVYYVVTTSAVAPTASQIIAGNDENDVIAFKSGNAPASAGVDLDQSITGLTESTLYHVYSIAADAATNTSVVDSESATTPCTPTNVSNLKISDTNNTATLYWSDPTCFDEIIIAAKLAGAITGMPSGDGTAYTTNLNFSTASAADFDASAKIVFKGGAGTGGGAGQTVTNLTVGNVYNFKIFTRKGTTWSSGNMTSTATGAPLIVSVVPADNSTGIPTDQVFTITFNENIFISATASSIADDDVIRFAFSGTDPQVPRGSSTISPSGSGTIDRTGKIATVILNSDMDINELYNVRIGNKVFRDSSANNFAGTVDGDWNFTTAAGAAVTAATAGTCAGQFTPLGDIVITETNDNNFQGIDNGSRTIVLSFDKTGFIFNPSVSGVTATPAPGGDIASITTTSVSFTQATFTVQFSNVSNDGQARDDHDAITISGLKVSRDGSNAPPAIIWLDNASTLTIQGIAEQAAAPAFATVNGGSIPTAPTIAYPAGDNTYCVNATFSGLTITASDPDVPVETFNWYDNAGLTVVNALGANSRTVAQLIGGSPAVGTYTRYATQVDGCESAAATVTIVVTALPTASAGANQTGAGAVCPNTSVALGGSPTASGGTGSYTYAWTGPGSPVAVSNPNHIMPDPGVSNQIYNYQVTVTDGNGCSSSPAIKQVEVKTVSQNVVFDQPSTFFYTVNSNPVDLVGSPAGGTFSGVGVIQLNGAYQFDPELAGVNSPGGWPVTYTVTLSNGCTKSIVQNFEVSAAYDVFPALDNTYCNNEPSVLLQLSPALVADMQAYIASWNAYATLNPLSRSLLKTTFTGIIRNEYEGYYGDNNSVQQVGGTYSSGGMTLNNHRFYPTAIQTDNAYPGPGQYGACTNCNYAYISIFVEFADPTQTLPYNMPPGTDVGWRFNTGSVAGFSYSGEWVDVNPVPIVNFSGLGSSYCNINTDVQLTGNKPGGIYEISSDNVTFGDVVSPVDGIKDLDEGMPGGLGEFNPLEAVGAIVSATTQYIKYSVDPGTTGSTGQGCVGSQTRATTVYPSTPISFDASVPIANSEFCYEGAAIDIITDAGTPPASGSINFTGFGIANNVGNGTARFTPQTAFEQKNPGSLSSETITITATYTNAQGCAYPLTRDFIVRPRPVSIFTVTDQGTGNPPPDLNFCYNDNPLTLQGNSSSGTVRYFIDYKTLGYTQTQPLNEDNITFEPDVYFNDFDAQGGTNVSDATFDIRYVVTDALGCTASSTKGFAVSPLADIEFFEAADGDVICENVAPFNITFSPIGGSLKVNTIPTTLVNNALPFISLAPNNSIDLEYTYNSGVSQCTTVETITISKIAAPKAAFTAPPICDGDAATFSAGYDIDNYNFKWVLGDSVRSGTANQSIQHVFPGLAQGATQTSYLIRLVVENDYSIGGALKVCRDSTEANQIVGAYPNVDFNYADVCQNDFTRFSISSSIPIASAEWDFGDALTLANNPLNANIPGGMHGGQTQGKYGQPEHRFASPSRYDVRLIGRTAPNVGACANTITREIAILQKLTPTRALPYAMSQVNGGDGFWEIEDRSDSSTWEFGIPSGKVSITNAAGSAWITNAAGFYKAKDNSFVNSPCFDLSDFSKPVIGLQFWNNNDGGKDGAVLQYSVNGGASWQVVGTPTSGTNWYTNATISSAPGGFNQFGWTSRFQQQWLTGKNSLDAVAGNNNVRFRIAFASDEREEFDGFAFNNVVIEERNRFMLIEHFTNADTDDTDIPTSNNNYNSDIVLNDPAEVVKIQYHTSFPDPDPINASNPADHNARAAFYGVTSQTVPLGFIDGNRDLSGPFGFVSPPNPPWWNDFKQKRSLNSSSYTLFVQSEPSASTDDLTVHVTGSRVSAVPGNRPVLHVVVIEKDVAGNEHVVRKLLPNASGTPLSPTATTVDQTYTWRAEGLADLTDLAIVAFIQDEVTKEIHQAAIDLTPANLPYGTITGTEDKEYAEKINLFPNPANHEINIQLPSNVTKNTPIRIIDTYGRTMVEKNYVTGERTKTINTSELIEGIYIIQIDTPEGKSARRKIMVIHR
jgi:hypothetical protein